MSLFPRLRRSPWLAGALLLVLAAGLVAPVAWLLGLRHWSLYAGLIALMLLLFGGIERLYQSRPLPRRTRPSARSRFRVFMGGKAQPRGRGNGHAEDLPDEDSDSDKPRWIM